MNMSRLIFFLVLSFLFFVNAPAKAESSAICNALNKATQPGLSLDNLNDIMSRVTSTPVLIAKNYTWEFTPDSSTTSSTPEGGISISFKQGRSISVIIFNDAVWSSTSDGDFKAYNNLDQQVSAAKSLSAIIQLLGTNYKITGYTARYQFSDNTYISIDLDTEYKTTSNYMSTTNCPINPAPANGWRWSH